MNWNCVPFGTYSGQHNMSVDKRLLDELQARDRHEPVIRFYCWDKPTISLGKNQSAETAVDLAEMIRLGYGLVQRPTGGRALLHKGDISYAIVASRDSHPEFHSLTSTYRAIGRTISAFLMSLGVTVGELPVSGAGTRSMLTPCFAMMNPFEIAVRGRKICGSAQFRSGNFFLQHGSVRIFDNWNAEDLITLWPKSFQIDPGLTTSLEAELSVLPTLEFLAQAFCRSFETELGLQLSKTSTDFSLKNPNSLDSH